MGTLVVDELMLREPSLLVPRKQPIGSVRINEANPLTNGLAGVWFFRKSANSLLERFGNSVFTGNARLEKGCLVLDGAGDYLTASSPITAAPVSLGFVAHSMTAADEVAIMLGTAATAWTGYYIAINTTTPSITATSVKANTFDGSSSARFGTYPLCACMSATASRLQSACNGVLGTEDTSFTDPGELGTTVLRIGASARNSAGSDIIGELPFACVWKRALTDSELCDWTADPYQIMVPI
jgi:hypothetical protein